MIQLSFFLSFQTRQETRKETRKEQFPRSTNRGPCTHGPLEIEKGLQITTNAVREEQEIKATLVIQIFFTISKISNKSRDAKVNSVDLH